ncbi:class I SAM-dependent methyltransferase [Clostridium ljungdahlii]|uniref:Methyltransferase YcgJ n=1 Tax=Clostridium ljungdahlii (strain ATCC 55383 / DSM 13528 / PETC) TaxID=748727 RepID=D8GLD8_CLOLD|nr:class I SAM-dependent methyltransferase [Clostridium ljungdahlii]ADK15497.1 predicted methyltransferase [Clostridium ljungdahlii DSM 13528]OAA85503.1 putative methyltransferase YcgJ [Clostridium ljungdahlii DSM 13528]
MNSVGYFDSIADKWDVIREDYFEDKLKYIALSQFNIKNKICADLGCGTGFISLALAQDAKLVFSLDNSRNMLKQLHSEALDKSIKNIYPIKGSMSDLPLFDESIDVVFVNMALHHVVDAKKAINEIYRVLKKDGTFVICDVEEHDGEWARIEMHDEWLGFSHKMISDWVKNAGFKDIQVESTGLKCTGYSSKGECTEPGIFMAKGIKRGE